MKILIWFGCIFAASLINTLFIGNGVRLGAIPSVLIYVATVWAAQTLCKKWEETHPKN